MSNAQREHHLWKKVIYALESRDETQLPELPIPFSHFFLSQDRVLCRYWPQKPVPVEQLVIPEKLVSQVLSLIHDIPIAGHPGREKTLAAARKRYYWPTLRIDVESHVKRCITCARHKGTVRGPAPILQYLLPEAPWDIVSIDLLQLPQSQYSSQYLLVCVDHLTRYVVLAPLKDKTATRVAHALVTHLFCPFSTPRVTLSDNRVEFRNAVVAEICSKFGITQTFTTAYHPASNGLVERANRKILEVLRPIVNDLLYNWEDWLPHIVASINSSVNYSTGKSPHYISFGVEKRFPYGLLTSTQQPIYNIEKYSQQQIHVFSKIHSSVRQKLKATKAEMIINQHKRAIPVNIKQWDTVMIQQPERKSKLSPKFVGPYGVVRYIHGNKFEVVEQSSNVTFVVHADRLKLIRPSSDTPLVTNSAHANNIPVENNNATEEEITRPVSVHTYNLQPRE